MAKDNYTSDSIRVLNSIDHIQTRYGMYIGEGENPSCLLSEIFDNGMDEVTSGYSDKVVVNVDTKKNIYTIRDYGRGIPHGMKELENGQKKETLEVLMTIANSGGKFDQSSYKFSSGLHGVGLTVTNALSNYIKVTTYRNQKSVSLTCEKGIPTKEGVVYGEQGNNPTGTEVIFCPNPKYFHNEVIPVKFIEDRCKVASALGYKAELTIDGKKVKTTSDIFSLIKEEEDSKVVTYHDLECIDVKDTSGQEMKVALRYTSDTKDKYFGYTNMTVNYIGGTHVQLLSKTIGEAWEEFLDTHKNLRPETKLHKSDYTVGLRGICAVFIEEPVFSSQTKEKLATKKDKLQGLMTGFKKTFKKYLDKNILLTQQLLKRFEEYRISQNSLLNRKEISSLIKINNDDGDNIRRRSVVSKLIECTSKKRADTELFIVEGNSAAGPYRFTRDVKTQAIIPLRGKIKNVTGLPVKECIQNSEVCDIANSIGCGIGTNCDASKSRYDRIIISADADVDGMNITCLLLTLFVNLFPDLVREGMVYVSYPPLYYWKNKKSFAGCMDIADVPQGITPQRVKGLGEFENDALKYFLVDKNTRFMTQIEYPTDVDKFNSIMGTTEGKNELLKNMGVLKYEAN